MPRLFGVVLLTLSLAACEPVDDLREAFSGPTFTPHQRYGAALAEAGLAETALGRAWTAAADAALAEADSVAMPFREVRFLDPARPAAIGYRFDARRGQELFIDIDRPPGDTTRLFIDLFEAPRDATDAPRPLRSADSTASLRYKIRRDRTYLLRVQPELLRGGRFTVTVHTDASLAFPVAGKNSTAIRSFFGDRRDGGRRKHHGVDIFAPKGTPALAATDAYVTRVRNGGLGGKSVWLRDADGHNLYYAHLDSQLVQRGMRVAAGDTVGLVGQTGNARNTPPHLHFGIYQNGPTDPFPFIHQIETAPAAVRIDTSRLGRSGRIQARQARLRGAPAARAETVAAVPRHTAFVVEGGSGRYYRVRLPDGTAGYLPAAEIEPAETPLRHLALAAGQALRAHPAQEAPAVDSLAARARVPVLGTFEEFVYVEAPGGQTGWIVAE